MNPRYAVRPALLHDLSSVLDVLAQNQAESPSDDVLSNQHVASSEEQLAMWERVQATPDVTV